LLRRGIVSGEPSYINESEEIPFKIGIEERIAYMKREGRLTSMTN